MLNLILKEEKHLAVAGLMEYKNSIIGVDDWYENDSEINEQYEYIIKKQADKILIYTPNWNNGKGVSNIYNLEDEEVLLQALIYLISKKQFIGLDWYDVIHTIGDSATFEKIKTNMSSYENDIDSWRRNAIYAKSDSILCLVCGDSSFLDANRIANKMAINFDGNIMFAAEWDDHYGDEVIISIWSKNN